MTDPNRHARPGPGIAVPTAPHDDLSIDELAERYNFRNTSSMHDLMARALIKEIAREKAGSGNASFRALNVGCGRGIGRGLERLLAVDAVIDEHWGVEPDRTIEPLDIFARFEHATIEQADLPAAYFDLVYSTMVIEHVADPDGFMAAIARTLKPGGIHVFMTVNGAHYFARTAHLMNRLRLEERILRLTKGGAKNVEYHYPVQYRMNTLGQLRTLAQRHGFDEPTLAFFESVGPRGYLRGPLRPLLWAMNAKRRCLRNPRALLTILGRMRLRETHD